MCRWKLVCNNTYEDDNVVEWWFASDTLKEDIHAAITKIFEQHQDTLNIRKSILLPIPKSNKPSGPVKNFQLSNLLITAWKVLQKIILVCKERKAEGFLPPQG